MVVLEPIGSILGIMPWNHPYCDAAEEVAARLGSGTFFVNEVTGTAPDLPFGGIERSGVGCELGRFGIEQSANKKLIHVPRKEQSPA